MALRPISRMDGFVFPAEAWDVRGWTVRTDLDGDRVGKVDDMLLDGDGTLRFLDVDLGFLKRHVLVPLDRAHADREEETVRIEGMTREQLESVPEYGVEPESLDEGYERRLDAVYGREASDTGSAAPTSVATDAVDDARDLELRRMDAIEDEYRVSGTDPRGWGVVTADGRKVGKVAELLMDPGAMKARFLDVAVDEKELELEPVQRHILLPAERVRLERTNKRVVVSGLLAADLASYPQYGGLPVHGRTVHELDRFFDRVAAAGTPEADRGAGAGAGTADWHDTTLRHFYQPAPRARARNREER